MKKAATFLAFMALMIFAAGCIGQATEEQPGELKITEVSLGQGEITENQTAEMFITVKSFDERALEAVVQLSAAREEDKEFIRFMPETVDYGRLKKGEEVRRAFAISALVAAGERITYRFRIELAANETVVDSKERTITAVRE